MNQGQKYDVILGPIITEKATLAAENDQVIFSVPLTATKPMIKEAVEGLFERKVKAVNTIRSKGKVKRFRGQMGKRKDTKKAIVTFVEGQAPIDVTSGL